MVLYDEFGELLGASLESIKLFGFSNIDDFKDNIKDIADFFVKKEGYIYKFDHYSWIDYLNYSEENINQVLIKQKDNQIIQATISIHEIQNLKKINDSNITYIINFTNKKQINIEENTTIQDQSELENDFEDIEENDIIFLFDNMSEEYDVDRDLYIELLNDFIIESKESIELIEAYMQNNNYEQLYKIVRKLKNICINLKLDLFLPLFNSIEKSIANKKYDNVEKFIGLYKKEIDLLWKKVRQISAKDN